MMIFNRALQSSEIINVSESITGTPFVGNAFYKNGFITRFFVQKRSDRRNPIIEVPNYDGFPSTYNYQMQLDWKISGPPYDNIYTTSGATLEKSCYNYNRHSVAYLAAEYPQILAKITNFLFLVKKKQ